MFWKKKKPQVAPARTVIEEPELTLKQKRERAANELGDGLRSLEGASLAAEAVAPDENCCSLGRRSELHVKYSLMGLAHALLRQLAEDTRTWAA